MRSHFLSEQSHGGRRLSQERKAFALNRDVKAGMNDPVSVLCRGSSSPGMGNIQSEGHTRPAKSFGLVVPRQLQAGLEIQ